MSETGSAHSRARLAPVQREARNDAAPLRSLPPCGGGTGREVANSSLQDSRLNPPPQPSPTRGEGARRASGALVYRSQRISSHAPVGGTSGTECPIQEHGNFD